MSTTVVDIQALQNIGSAGRGIGRYIAELTDALNRWHPGAVGQYLLNPDLPVPASLERGVTRVHTSFSDGDVVESARVLHVASPFEPVGLERLWPRPLRTKRLVVTLHDLIPLVLRDLYLTEPAHRRLYLARIDFLRRADRVIAVSAASAHDAVEHLGIHEDRLAVIGEAPAERFRPPSDRAESLDELTTLLPGVRPGFIFYQGGVEPRKNLDRLFEAYGALPPTLREHHQLLVVCPLPLAHRTEFERRLTRLGIADDVLLPGYVSDDVLLLIHQTAHLSVFPSLYEGFGLPVVEAMACGTPVIAARTSSLVELIDDEAALFDPYDVRAIRDALVRALTDDALLARLRAKRLDPRYDWRNVADRTARVYEEAGALGERSRRRPAVAFVGPMPSQPSLAAEQNAGIAAALSDLCAVDVFCSRKAIGEGMLPPGRSRLRPIESFEAAERGRDTYDAVIYSLADDEAHVPTLELARRRSGVVLAHDVRLSNLYAAAPPEVRRGAESLGEFARDLYRHRVAVPLGTTEAVDPKTLPMGETLLAADAISRAERFLVQSAPAAQLARIDAAAGDALKVDVIPFGYPSPRGAAVNADAGGRPLVVAVSEFRQPGSLGRLLDAVARAQIELELLVIGPVSATEAARVLKRVEQLGLGRSITMLEFVADRERRACLSRASCVIDLSASALDAVTPARIADALAAGTPTLVTAVGAFADLPDDVVVKVGREATADTIAHGLDRLLSDTDLRALLAERARSHAVKNSYRRAAEALCASAGVELVRSGSGRKGSIRRRRLLLGLLARPLAVVDVGSRWGVDDLWWQFEPRIEIFGFEPDADECRQLSGRYAGRAARFFALALGERPGTETLHVASDPGSSSLYEPDRDAARARPELERLTEVGTVDVEVTTLDAWAAAEGVEAVDVIKLDVQGSELAVLTGGEQLVSTARMVEAEVEFNPMYLQQPLFGEIDAFLRERGFVLWRLKHLVHYGDMRTSASFEVPDEHVFDNQPVPVQGRGGQLYWAHAYFVPREVALGGSARDWSESVRDSLVAEAYGFGDLAEQALERAAAAAPARAEGILALAARTGSC